MSIIPAPLPNSESSTTHSPTRVALVTGAAQGIGRGIALRLASDGFDVALNDIPAKLDALGDVVSEIEALGDGRRAIVVTGDVSLEADVERAVEETVKQLGSLDVMVANAGVARVGSITEVSVEDFDLVVGVNFRGVLLCYKHAARQMIKQGRGGRIIGASSVAGLQAFPLAALYSGTKFAVRGLTQVTAMELAPHRITVNCYAPGLITSSMTSDPVDELAKGEGYGKLLERIGFEAGGHVPGPEVVASAVSYLCKPEAYFITGNTIGVSGGVIMH